MRTIDVIAIALAIGASSATPTRADDDMARWMQEAAAVEITRDDWGIAHVHGHTDADAVFGAIYAQCEDDFRRVETNYLTALGRMAEAEGEKTIWQDLRQRLFIDPDVLRADYAKSPDWLRKLMNAWADGMNFYLATHPKVTPRVITRYEPWMALAFTEGSIGGDIEDAKLPPLAAFYGKTRLGMIEDDREARGSNGIAIAPGDSADGHALLLINPHVTFFFRSELQMMSDEGLDAYGAATWGQFFIYQGFNENVGWMHTTTGVDNVDEFAETIIRRGWRFFYRYGNALRPVGAKRITVRYRTDDGGTAERTFTTFFTHHGPIVRTENGRWIALALMNDPIEALEQSFLRTKTSDLASFMKAAALQANSSNNTVFADTKGEIAFLVPQFVPKRDNRFDYTKPVDGADPASDWQGPTPLDALPQVVNPPNGWLFNSNNWPWSVAGPNSPKAEDYPRYLDQAGENARGLHAVALLTARRKLSPEGLEALAFDSFLPAFAKLIPALTNSYDALPAADPLRVRLKDEIAVLRDWDFRWSADSVATTLAVTWGDALWTRVFPAGHTPSLEALAALAQTTPSESLDTLSEVSSRLVKDFGTWRVAWGDFNRFQHLNDDIPQSRFNDSAASLAVPFVYSRWGSLASFAARRFPNTTRYYGTAGNSFVAVVDFGPRIRALAISTGGESGDPASPHFNDQAVRYVRGELRPVYFYPSDLLGHTERTYHPGER